MKNKSLKILSLLSAALFLSPLVHAGDDAALAKIRAKYASFTKDVADMTMKQEVHMQTGQTEMKQESELFRKGNKFRMNSVMDMGGAQGMPQGMPKMETIILHDGTNTWMISPFTGKKMLSENEAGPYRSHQDPSAFLENAEVIGSENVNGRDCYIVKTSAEGGSVTLWLDKKSLVTVQGETGEGETKVRWMHSDFRKVKGDWEVPFKTEMYQGEQLLSVVEVKNVSVNTGLSDDLFDPNRVEVKGMDMQSMMQQMMSQQS
jgi:outer membrane lipoprotein-sorting protein